MKEGIARPLGYKPRCMTIKSRIEKYLEDVVRNREALPSGAMLAERFGCTARYANRLLEGMRAGRGKSDD